MLVMISLICMLLCRFIFHFLVDGHAPSQGGDSRALSRLPASQLGSQSGRAVHYYFVSELLPVQCTNQIIVHGTAGSGCLTEMQVAWIVHGCLRLRVDVAVY